MPDSSTATTPGATDAQSATAPDPARATTVTLAVRDELGSDYLRLTFRADRPIGGRAGHFGMIRSDAWGHAPLLARPMSLLSAGDRPSMLIKVVGEGTRRMAAAPLGERFSLLAPLGTPWRHPERAQQAIVVAGGVGLPPVLLLAQEIAAARKQAAADPPQTVGLYGGRTAADLPLADELGSVADLRIATEDGSRGARGRVTVLLEDAIADVRRRGAEPAIYACGPQAMLRAVAQIAAQADVPCQVSLEALMGCGYGVCLGCPTARAGGGYLYTCTEGPCVDAAAVDWEEVGS
ncbi:MAG: dihydroorotate dehydrogenase electron transfer subunit [Deltaproteobacteria bacterium]|jgi:dihydroorotate dehydrogenase electron transfer subunit|nr:dihydroorotate dehydrogenase electron transfer subunit [Deltaproteobacteria bacterium]MBW2530202.1 dihydroorotate dehydrogenase electron transfer subunit [Deltaproteobacteria bacterium]